MQSLIPQTELFTLYAEAEYDLTDNLTAYGEVLFNRRKTKADSYQQYWSYLYSGDFDFGSYGTGVPGGGSELSAAAGWFGEQWFSPTAITDNADESAEIDYLRFVAGLRGSFNENWEWDLSFQYSDSDATYNDDRIFADAIFDNNFGTESCVGTVSSVRGVPCVDIPWFDPDFLAGVVSPEVQAFLWGNETGTTKYQQWSIDGYTTGNLFNMPAGSVGIAVGFHYREDDMTDTPGIITFDPATGEGNSWLDDFAGITTGKDKTIAFFGEVDVPLLADKPLIESLTLNASTRYNDVDCYGDGTTWKVGLNWQVTPTFRLRANRGTSFRAPALFELFLADQTSIISQRADPCRNFTENFNQGLISPNVHANCLADPRNLPVDYTGGTVTPTVLTGGGFGVLEAETADTLTVGFVWQPDFADLSISVDYFDIEVNDEVNQLGGVNILLGCYESDFGFAFSNTEPLCDLFDRTGINFGADNIRDSFINIASQKNRGFDFQVRYSTDLPWGNLLIELDATRQVEDLVALFTETPEDRNGLVGDPKWVGASRITFSRNEWNFFYGMTYVGKSSNEEKFGRDFIIYRGVNYDAVLGTGVVLYHNLSASYQMDNGLTILAGVANAFDRNPEQLTNEGIGTDQYEVIGNTVLVSQYDPLGRRFFLNLTKNF